MNIRNFEFKAKVGDLDRYEQLLLKLNPTFKGIDYQKDTYFNAKIGRLKLREGNIENAIIMYNRSNDADAKESTVILYQHQPNEALKAILDRQFGIKVVVEKARKIYYIDHVKFHFDVVTGLGTFMEVEVIDHDESYSLEELKQQCNHYMQYFGLNKTDLIDVSYSDLLMVNS